MKKIKYIRYLDYLRVFLAIFVIQVHLTMNNSLLNSWFFDPVLLFFAISGYSNFMSWKQKESIWKFYKKRLWTLVLSGIIVGFIIDITYIPFHLSKLNNLSLDTFATTSFLKVFVFEPLITLFPYFHNIIGGDIQFLETWEALSVDMSSPVVWSLKMELLFYLIFPFIMKFYFHFKNWKKNLIYIVPIVGLLVQQLLYNDVFHSKGFGDLHVGYFKNHELWRDFGIFNPLKVFNIFLPHFFIGILCAQLYTKYWKKMWNFARKYRNIFLIFKSIFLLKLISVIFTIFMSLIHKTEFNIPAMFYMKPNNWLFYYLSEWFGLFMILMLTIIFDLSSINPKKYYNKLKNNTNNKINLGLITYVIYISHPYFIKLLLPNKKLISPLLSAKNYQTHRLWEIVMYIILIISLVTIITIITYRLTNLINKKIFNKKKITNNVTEAKSTIKD